VTRYTNVVIASIVPFTGEVFGERVGLGASNPCFCISEHWIATAEAASQ
jgi:hypothetical protein